MVPGEHKIACGTEEVGGSSGTGNGIKCLRYRYLAEVKFVCRYGITKITVPEFQGRIPIPNIAK